MKITKSRSLVLFCAALVTGPSLAAPQPESRELTADAQIAHALNRLTFGARPGDAMRIRATGLDRWIESQLTPAKIPDTAVDRFIAGYKLINRDQNELLRQYAEMQFQRRQQKRDAVDSAGDMRRDSMQNRQRARLQRGIAGEVQSVRMARAVASERQLLEVMTDFWENHFSVFIRKGAPMPYYLTDFDRVVRANALGNFRILLGAVAKSPAMLFYLDNARSMSDSTHNSLATFGRRRPPGAARRGSGLNENYGRELLELHTLGVDGGYTQRDVIEVARALTGWTIRQPQQGGGFIFRPQMHDADEKLVLGVRFPAGRGIEDGEQVLDILARHPATARFIATKLVRRFVSDTPPPALVARVAAVFMRTDGDIRETLRAVITSPEFFAQSAFRSKVKSPFEVVVSAARALGAQPDSTPATALASAFLGQPLFGRQAPDGYSETSAPWMNAGAILNRINFGMAIAANRLPGTRVDNLPEATALRGASRERQVDAVIAALLAGAASPDTRAILLKGENPLAGGESDIAPIPKLTGLDQVVGLAIGSPEFQRR